MSEFFHLTRLMYSVPIYPNNATFSTNISSAEVHVSNDGRFLYASNRNLTVATTIKAGDVSAPLFVEIHSLIISALRYNCSLVYWQ